MKQLVSGIAAMLLTACGSVSTEAPPSTDQEPVVLPTHVEARKQAIIEPTEDLAPPSSPVPESLDAGPPPVPGADVPSFIPCESVRDCWFELEPIRPAPRPRRLRGKKFRPCHDGEAAPVCGDGRCGLVFYEC